VVPSYEHVLVLGFYDRRNLGDDAYQVVFSRILPGCRVVCSDDVAVLPYGTQVLVCGGGDIINPYFMNKVRQLLAQHQRRLPCYAVSVGIPYVGNAAAFLDIFDHAIVRSSNDLETARTAMLTANASRQPDLSSLLVPVPVKFRPLGRVAGVALAQPLFANNPNADKLIVHMVEVLKCMLNLFDWIWLLPFNVGDNPNENDVALSKAIEASVGSPKLVTLEGITDPEIMLGRVAECDLVLGMRYHSVVFSMLCNRPFVALYSTRKIANILAEHQCQQCGMRMPTDAKDRPVDIDVDGLVRLIYNTSLNTAGFRVSFGKFDVGMLRTVLDQCAPRRCPRLDSVRCPLEACLQNFDGLLQQMVALRYVETPLPGASDEVWPALSKEDATQIARLVCFSVTHRASSSYVWGVYQLLLLSDEHGMTRDRLHESIRWIHEEESRHMKQPLTLYPPLCAPLQVAVDVSYMDQDDFRGYHRSGWSYVLGGLMQLDKRVQPAVYGWRDAPTRLLQVDTYVDRTFHWASAVCHVAGIIPYRRPWLGFVHHTFDTRYSKYNVHELFRNPLFLESLSSCKGLIVLSMYLRTQLLDRLHSIGQSDLPVFMLPHPTELVRGPESQFSIPRFLDNPDKKVIQVGAWLRNSYAIYQLPLYPDWNNPFKIRKCALRGKDMSNYFREPGFFNKLVSCTSSQQSQADTSLMDGISRDCVFENKYVQGMFGMLWNNDASVDVMSHLADAEYDRLLAENIVFLNLYDASACNTVIECVVRGTILLVNRHPAIEEVLGTEYPGFYENLHDAANALKDLTRLCAAHAHLIKLDKHSLRLDTFIAGFQAIVRASSVG
jgi:hypothetical protein